MNLHLRQAVNDLTAGVLEHLGVVDVVLLVKPGAQLQKAEHALSPIRGICERRGNLAACREPVERDADGNDVRIVRRLVEVFHKRAHALERVREQKILLFQIREKLALLQLHRFPAAPLGILHAGRLLHAGAEREIERQLCGKNVALRHLEILDERRAQPRGRFAADHEAHRLLALALAQHFLHAGAEVRVISAQIVVNEYVGVARDLQKDGVAHLLLFKELRHVVAHKLRRKQYLLPSVQLHNAPRRQTQQRNKTEPEVVALADRRRRIYFTAGDERERMPSVHDARREQRPQLGEVLLCHDLLGLRHFMKVQHVDPGVAHVLEKPPVDALLARLLRSDGGKNGAHLLAGGATGLFVRVVRQQRRAVRERADANHEELLKIRAVDAKELEPLEKRHGRIARLLEHAQVKLQPAQLTVKKQTRGPALGKKRRLRLRYFRYGGGNQSRFFFGLAHSFFTPRVICSFTACSSVSVTIRRTRMRAYFLSTDSMICQGAYAVLVFCSISSTAVSYSGHLSRLRQYSSVIFHCFSGVFCRSSKRSSCVSGSIWIQNLRTIVP